MDLFDRETVIVDLFLFFRLLLSHLDRIPEEKVGFDPAHLGLVFWKEKKGFLFPR